MAAELDKLLASLRKLEQLGEDCARECADAVRDALHETIAAGTTPDGVPWPKRKRDGKQPLRNAAAHLTVVPVGTTILVRERGPEARHNSGAVNGGTVRRIIPAGSTVPAPIRAKLKQVFEKRFAAIARGSS